MCKNMENFWQFFVLLVLHSYCCMGFQEQRNGKVEASLIEAMRFLVAVNNTHDKYVIYPSYYFGAKE